MSKKSNHKNKDIKQSSINQNVESNSSNSLTKTYSIIGGLILIYFFTTFSYKSIDKKMDKIAKLDTTISQTLDIDNNLLLLSSGDNFLGLTNCSSLPLGRLSIKSTTNKSFNSTSPNIITYEIKSGEDNVLIIAGKKDDYKQIIFSDIMEHNGNKTSNDITLDLLDDEYFLISTNYKDSYENIRLITNDDTIIEINE